MECLIDTSVLVDYIIKGSDMHGKAKEILENIDYGFLPSVVVEELVYVLVRLGLNKKDIGDEVVRAINSYDLIGVDANDVLFAKEIIMREEPISFKKFNDKLILSIAKREALQLLTFDGGLIEECKSNSVKFFPFDSDELHKDRRDYGLPRDLHKKLP